MGEQHACYLPYRTEVSWEVDGQTQFRAGSTVAIYELSAGPAEPAVYVGQTCRSPQSRVYTHVHLARHEEGKNRRLEAWIRRRIQAGQPLHVRVVDVAPVGAAGDAAERARIAALRAQGHDLMNQGPGGERAPVGRLVPPEQRRRAALARRAIQRSDVARRHQSIMGSKRRHQPLAYDRLLTEFIESRGQHTKEAICMRCGLPGNALTILLSGRANALVVDGDLLARAREADAELQRQDHQFSDRVRKAAEAVADDATSSTTIGDAARSSGLGPKFLAEAIRRRRHGITDVTAATVRQRVQTHRRRCMSALGRRGRRVDHRHLRSLLQAYARGAIMMLNDVAARLGISTSHVSSLLGRGAFPRRLTQQCRARARLMKGTGARTKRMLTPDQVSFARQRRADGERLCAIAAEFGVSKHVLSRAVRGRSYRDV